MPKASKSTAAEKVEIEGYVGHLQKVDGGYTIAFENYTQNADLSPLLEGLPNNQCQAAHWGYVVKGSVSFDFGGGNEETFEAGDAYYAPPGHTPKLSAGTEIVEFSPTEEHDKTMQAVKRNMQSGGA